MTEKEREKNTETAREREGVKERDRVRESKRERERGNKETEIAVYPSGGQSGGPELCQGGQGDMQPFKMSQGTLYFPCIVWTGV